MTLRTIVNDLLRPEGVFSLDLTERERRLLVNLVDDAKLLSIYVHHQEEIEAILEKLRT